MTPSEIKKITLLNMSDTELTSNALIINTLHFKSLNPNKFPATHFIYEPHCGMETHTTALSEAFQSHLLPNILTLKDSDSLTCV